MDSNNECIYNCPSLEDDCDWQGTKEDLNLHFKYYHYELYTDDSKYNILAANAVNCEKNILLKNLGCLFLLQLKSDIQYGKFWCGVRYINHGINVEHFFYSISFFNGKTGKRLYRYGRMQLDIDCNFEEKAMMEFDLNCIKSKTNNFKINFKVYRYNSRNIAKIHRKFLIDEISCVICRRCIMTSSVFLCLAAHTICINCKGMSKIQRCEYNGYYSKCNLQLKDVTKHVWHYCDNKSYGCNFIGKKGELKEHVSNCTIVSCVIGDTNQCKWKGLNELLSQHLESAHSQQCPSLQKCSWHYCDNKNYGCKFIGKKSELKKHASDCTVVSCDVGDANQCKWKGLKQLLAQHIVSAHSQQCPSLQKCSWQGRKQGLCYHFKHFHSKAYTNNNIFCVFVRVTESCKGNIFMNSLSGRSFLLQFISEVNSKKFWGGVRFISPNGRNDREDFIFSVSYTNLNNKEISRFGTMQNDSNWTFDKNAMMELNLDSVKRNGIAKNSHYKIRYEVHGYNAKIIANIYTNILFGQLNCLVCQKQIKSCVFLCLAGHIICNECAKKYIRCEYGEDLNKCSLKLVDVTQHLQDHCRNKEFDCDFIGKPDQLKMHAWVCSVIPCLLHECDWNGMNQLLPQHLLSTHSQNITRNDEVVLYDLSENLSVVYLFNNKYPNVIFKIYFEIDYRTLIAKWTCSQINLGFSKHLPHKLLIQFVDCNELNLNILANEFIIVKLFYKNNSVTIPFDTLRPLMAGNSFKVIYAVEKM